MQRRNKFINFDTDTNTGANERNNQNENHFGTNNSAYNNIIIGNDDSACNKNNIINVGTDKNIGTD